MEIFSELGYFQQQNNKASVVFEEEIISGVLGTDGSIYLCRQFCNSLRSHMIPALICLVTFCHHEARLTLATSTPWSSVYRQKRPRRFDVVSDVNQSCRSALGQYLRAFREASQCDQSCSGEQMSD